MTTAVTERPGTRAVERLIVPGDTTPCMGGCGEDVKFRARSSGRKVVANVYGRNGDPDVWDRVEIWHKACYEKAGMPFGPLATETEESLRKTGSRR